MKLISLLSTLVFVNIHYIRGNGIRIPLSIYEPGLRKSSNGFYEDDQELYGTISIGTPPQKINVRFSTVVYTSMYVLSSYCNSSVCQNHNAYNHKNSATFQGEDDFDTKIQQPRQDNSAYATDTITIGNFQIQDVSFFVTTRIDSYDSKPYDGTVGLAPTSEFFQLCEKLGLKKEFSLYTNSPWDNNTSVLMLCGEDKTKFRGNLQYLTVITNTDWTIKTQRIMLHHNHENVAKMESQDAIQDVDLSFNFGSSCIIGPENDVEKIYIKLNTSTSKIRDDLQEVDCNNIHALPSITFKIGDDNNFTLTGNDYIKQMTQNYERVCIVRLLPHSFEYEDGVPSWNIGSVFFRKYYTVFDDKMPRRIGFAERVHPPAQIMVFLF